ncbi:Spo71p NDAI_0J01460 [Naumovozyma dairenensis CBS 421]|uniref:PH domain-containing protein n=1 Tax=Naumovozyma dairenensis (strain ATCC 10597 / BCRC 20456 / CBS 421 / NBRC 0211 / NRRL Y-12639) TaxID=1071378 RepID=G0WGW0_NAUDC|nr:hypothetical protein NDAI_0J01460 [Naumovozyma dairenensis CBS 421]CCD27038.1 hypothetical protein NDAI_0J01460 [Naumovozyma dairenensis CBS 421]
MPSTIKDIIDIITDEEKYIKHICPNTKEYKTFKIPRRSFTAFRLSYTSAVELSLCSKVVLLGGVPNRWYVEQKSGFRKAFSKIALRKLRKRTELLATYGYRTIYNKKQSRLLRTLPKASYKRLRNQYPSQSIPSRSQTAKLIRSPKGVIGNRRLVITNDGIPEIIQQRNKKAPNDVDELQCPRPSNSLTPIEDSSFRHDEPKRKTLESKFYTFPNIKASVHHFKPQKSVTLPSNFQNDALLHSTTTACTLESPRNSLLISPVNSTSNKAQRSSCSSLRPERLLQENRLDVALPNNKESVSYQSNKELKKKLKYNGQNHKPRTSKYNPSPVFYLAPPTISNGHENASKYYHSVKNLPPKPLTIKENENLVFRDAGDDNNTQNHRLKEELQKVNRCAIMEKVHKNVRNVLGLEQSLSNYILKKNNFGQILYMEKMLVMVKAAVCTKDPVTNFTENEPVDTRVYDRWKEYIVVARVTGRSDAPLLLQFYHSRKIPKKLEDKSMDSSNLHGSSLDFYLNKKCHVKFYSTLDRTICIQKPDDKITSSDGPTTIAEYKDATQLKFYILRCRTLHSSGIWFTFLRESLNLRKIPKSMIIKVPDVGVSLNIALKNDLLNYLHNLQLNEEDELKIFYLPRGYRILQFPFLRYITASIINQLRKARLYDQLKEWEKANVVLGCNLRRYDRIEWCSGHESSLLRGPCELMSSHSLEYRPLIHYPRSTTTSNKVKLIEPLPIEGFLIRYSNKYGQEWLTFGKIYLKPSYFFTSDNLLFSMSSFKSMPPLPIEASFDELENPHDIENDEKILNSLPMVYEQNPYALNLDSHISWLNDNMPKETFQTNDLYSFKCFNRRVAQILKAENILDMTKIQKVQNGAVEDLKYNEVKYSLLKVANYTFWERISELEDTVRSTIIITTSNKMKLKLLAPSPQVATEWATSLTNMSIYWKQRLKQDTENIWNTKMTNLSNLRIEELLESNICEETPKWVSDRATADPTIFNINSLSLLRPLIQKGILYQKPKKHAVFSKYYIVLIPGFLILFNCFHRSTTGFAKNVIDYNHYLTIPISECYLYSGTTTELDLLRRDHTFDIINPGNHAIPRAYDDGWKSTENESSRCFTLWFGTKRAIAKYSKMQEHKAEHAEESVTDSDGEYVKNKNYESNPGTLRLVNRLGVSGRSMVFMARSRQERDLWVVSIYNELERLKENDLE